MKYVLGGGLAGLITAYYNPEFTVLSPEVSGFIETKIGRAFVVIHEDDITTNLFRELEVPSFVKEIQIAYFEPSIGLEYDAPDWFKHRYLKQKLPARMQPPADGDLGGTPGSEFRALFVDENLIDALASEVEIETGYVTRIGPETLDFGDETREWDSIVSTMPAMHFADIVEADVEWELDHHPMTYAELDSVRDELRTRSWDYLYRVDDRPHTGNYHRVIRHMISSQFFVEYCGEIEFENNTNYTVNPNGVIQKEDIEPPYEGVQFNGRFAEWDPDMLVNDVAKKARDNVS